MLFDFAMLAKITAKNQLTLPKSVTALVGATEYLDVSVRDGQIILTPVHIQRGDAVRAKLAELGFTADSVAEALAWARGDAGVAPMAAEPKPSYGKPTRSASQPQRGAPVTKKPRLRP